MYDHFESSLLLVSLLSFLKKKMHGASINIIVQINISTSVNIKMQLKKINKHEIFKNLPRHNLVSSVVFHLFHLQLFYTIITCQVGLPFSKCLQLLFFLFFFTKTSSDNFIHNIKYLIFCDNPSEDMEDKERFTNSFL